MSHTTVTSVTTIKANTGRCCYAGPVLAFMGSKFSEFGCPGIRGSMDSLNKDRLNIL